MKWDSEVKFGVGRRFLPLIWLFDEANISNLVRTIWSGLAFYINMTVGCRLKAEERMTNRKSVLANDELKYRQMSYKLKTISPSLQTKGSRENNKVIRSLLLLTSLMLLMQGAWGEDTGWLSPTVTKDENSVSSQDNVFTSDNNRATWDNGNDWADYGNFNISSIPVGATINGIEIRVQGYCETGSGTERQLEAVTMSWNNGIDFSSGKAITSFNGTETYYTIGNSSDTWGHTWSTSEFSNTNFRIRLDAATATTGYDLFINHLQVRIYYTVPTPAYLAEFKSMNTGEDIWCPGETRTVSVTVKNIGTATWTDAAPDVNIGVKWNGDPDYLVRTDAGGLAPGATQTYSLTVTAPLSGPDNLAFDVVNEGNCWFGNNSGSCGPGNTVYSSTAITIGIPAAPGISAVNNCGNTVLTATGYSGTLLWSTGETTSSITVSSNGTYTVTQNVNGCLSVPGTANVTIKQLPKATVTDLKNITCKGSSDGTITISASEGTGPYKYSVYNGTGDDYTAGSNPYTFNGLSANTPYKIRVKDNNGCESISIP